MRKNRFRARTDLITEGDMLELADAVVVGGGILGVAVTHALSRRYSRVLLIEAERCGRRATAGGFAWVNASSKYHNEPYHRLNAEACRRHRELAAEWDAGRTGWHGGGTLIWASLSNMTEAGALKDRMETLQGWDYPLVRVERTEIQSLEPYLRLNPDTVGMFAPSEGWVDTARLVRFFLEEAQENRAEIAEFTTVTGFTTDFWGAIASVETTRGRVSTRILVVCAGVETGALAALARGYAGRRRPDTNQMSHGEGYAGMVGRSPGLLMELDSIPATARVHRVCFPSGASGLHLRPTVRDGLLAGADDTDRLCAMPTPPEESSAVLERNVSTAASVVSERLAQLLPSLDRCASINTRCCVRPMPSDGYPIVGELPSIAGAYLLVSHSGVTLGPLLSELLAEEIITGKASQALAPYRPRRFQE